MNEEEKAVLIKTLEQIYELEFRMSGLPGRVPMRHVAVGLVSAGRAEAYAKTLALVTGDQKWKDIAKKLEYEVASWHRMIQGEIDRTADAEYRNRNRLSRFGLR